MWNFERNVIKRDTHIILLRSFFWVTERTKKKEKGDQGGSKKVFKVKAWEHNTLNIFFPVPSWQFLWVQIVLLFSFLKIEFSLPWNTLEGTVSCLVDINLNSFLTLNTKNTANLGQISIFNQKKGHILINTPHRI